MRSIILDGSDDWPPTIGGGNTYYTGRKTKWQKKGILKLVMK